MTRPPPDPVFVLRGSDGAVNCLKFHCHEADSLRLLFSGTASGKIHPWNLQAKRSMVVLDGHEGQGILSLGFCDSTVLYSQGRDGTVALWDLKEGRKDISDRIPVSPVGFCQVELFNQGSSRLLAAAGVGPAEIIVTDLQSKKPAFSLQPTEGSPPQGMVMALEAGCVSDREGLHLWAAYEDGSVAMWDVKQRRLVSHLKVHAEPILCMDYDQEHGKGVTGSADNKLAVWNGKDGQLVAKQTVELSNPGLSCVKIRDDHKIVVTGGWDHMIRLYGWKKLKPLAVLDYHTDSVQCVDFSDHENSEERLLAAGSKDQRISLWSIYN
uniref:Uncharacterized protein n=1 Tax=Branchiostoma floridae TaxID=7739 RepID=C3XZ00_BRAFL|eukprot:XP_002610554.1 hypothetical protein BRAFLDRAFT_275805 [Branchiostoma floridae]